MSAIRKRPKVQSVTTTLVSAQNTLVSQQALKAATQQLSNAAQAILQQVQRSLVSDMQTLEASIDRRPVAQTLQQQALQLAQQSQLSLAETTQVAALVAATAYTTADPQPLQQAWSALQTVQSLETAQTALHQFTQTLEVQHQQVVSDRLALACTQAALKIGFQPLQSSVALDGTLRLLANDATGRTLVTEISTHPDQPLSMATELIGSSDETCEQILDAFDQALEAEGVRSGPPERKFTGGICELAAAQEFVRQRPKPKAARSQTQSTGQGQPRRMLPKPQNRQQRQSH